MKGRNITSKIDVQFNDGEKTINLTAHLSKYGDNRISICVNGIDIVFPQKALVKECEFIFDNS